ncbi:MAG: methyltransferase [Burkholderiales bacterium]|nr:methyltransferase [Burkholderiales bacterium]
MTPHFVVEQMVEEVVRRNLDVQRVVDCGAGTGRFSIAAAKAFPNAKIIAVECNVKLAALLQENLTLSGIADRVTVVRQDFRDVALAPIVGKTLYIGNPPYVRHHEISPAWKSWYQAIMKTMGVKASQLAGLHLHFFAKAIASSRPGDLVFFITAAEWLETKYGRSLRELILTKASMAEITVVDARIPIFEDAMATSTLTLIEVGKPNNIVDIRQVETLAALQHPNGFARFDTSACQLAARWSDLLRPQDETIGLSNSIQLGDVLSVHRGQVTGMNAVWVSGAYQGPLPDKVCFAAVTCAKDLLSLSTARLDNANALRRVIDLPADLLELGVAEQLEVDEFLKWAKSRLAHTGYIASHRKPWHRVGLRAPAPIVMTYMARRPPRFVRNICGARLINVAHGLYPKMPISDDVLDALVDWLNSNVSTNSGRTYAGGLIKFEPGEVMRLRIPRLESLARVRSTR